MRATRPRYIAILAEGPPPKVEQACLAALRAATGPREMERVRARLYHLGAGKAVVRMDHRTQDAARAALARVPGVRTIVTSGTLRQAKAALGVRSGPRRRRAGRDSPPPKRVNNRPGNR